MGVRSDGSLKISANADEYKSYPRIESSFKFNVPIHKTNSSINKFTFKIHIRCPKIVVKILF
jgi:hypothetical protein